MSTPEDTETVPQQYRFRLSRPCYDKPWRCPGWAGGGFKYPKVDRCEDGRVSGWQGSRLDPYLFHRCRTCGTVTFPYVLRWLAPSWIAWAVHCARR